MSRRAAGVVLALALALLLGLAAWWWLSERRPGRGDGEAEPGQAQVGEPVRFDLYFPAGTGLRAEPREIEVPLSPKARAARVVAGLLEGPRTAGLARPFPDGVELGGLQLTATGTAYVDLRWADHDDPPPGGSTEEMQRVYSVVNSLALNIPQIHDVVLLWNGSQRTTFSGHLDTGRPLLPDRGMVGEPTPAR
jgi:hypothetical protein